MFRILSFLINQVWTKFYVNFRKGLMCNLLATQPP